MSSATRTISVERATLGAQPLASGCTRFTVWAPRPDKIELHIIAPEERIVGLEADESGVCSAVVDGISIGARYFYRINGQDRPDPASRHQPEGVHGPSEVVSIAPESEENWTGLPLSEFVIYELHVGTFTPGGTIDDIVPELKRLKDLGITAVELMPVAEFPGSRNWGYDGVFPYSVHHCYGGPEALRRLARACHEQRMALVLDVVYNHFGPEGNYLAQFAPYFTSRYRTPWGEAVNFDDAYNDCVRSYFIENALYWFDCGVDALRLDAVHAMYDRSASPFLQELAEAVHKHAGVLGRSLYLIAESDLNDARLLLPPERGGDGLDAQWADDFHHCLHTALTGERDGYYRDFDGISQLAETLRQGWYYSGQYSPFRRRRHGNSPEHVRARQLVVCSQNHDQVGNRALGERLIQLAGFNAAKLAATAVVLSPFVPLLFMGEEYGETAPFLYFVSHSDVELVEAVRKGRRAEFSDLGASTDFPDPQDATTFVKSKLNLDLLRQEKHAAMNAFYRELLRLRRTHPALSTPTKSGIEVDLLESADAIVLRRMRGNRQAIVVLHFGRDSRCIRVHFPPGAWWKAIDSCDARWNGGASALAEEIDTCGGDSELLMQPLQAVVYLDSSV